MTCQHPISQWRSDKATGATHVRCTCGARFERMTTQYDLIRRQAAAIDRWSAIMRTSTSARKFALTGKAGG